MQVDEAVARAAAEGDLPLHGYKDVSVVCFMFGTARTPFAPFPRLPCGCMCLINDSLPVILSPTHDCLLLLSTSATLLPEYQWLCVSTSATYALPHLCPDVNSLQPAEFVASLKKPRAIIMLVQAGKPVDDTIAILTSYLEVSATDLSHLLECVVGHTVTASIPACLHRTSGIYARIAPPCRLVTC